MENRKAIYFDNSASAIINPKASEKAALFLTECANPSSLHFSGREMRKNIEEARKLVSDSFGCLADEMTFTSSGTESNNIAVTSLARMNRHYGNVIVTTKAEHPSVIETVRHLEKEGFTVIYVPVDGGSLDYGFLENTLSNNKVALVALMQANNRNGSVTDLKRVREIIRFTESKAFFHSDCVQGFLKVDDSMKCFASRYADTASVSAHKIGGIKGVGGLFVRKGLHLNPIIFGGGQERGLRSGTENTVGIIAFGEAAKSFTKEYRQKITYLREKFISLSNEILGENIEYKIPESHIDALVSVSIKNVKSEVCLNYLSSKNICVSASSACSSNAKADEAMTAFGYGDKYVKSSLRIGFSPFNTEEEVEILVKELKNSLNFHF